MKHYPLIRTIYLYLFALVGLALLTIGIVRLVDLGLKMYVFPKAEEQTYKSAPQIMTIRGTIDEVTSDDIEKIAETCQDNAELSEEQRELLSNWLDDYKEWEESQIDSEEIKSINRQRVASLSCAFILVGLPLYLFHWRIIKRETRNKKRAKIE